MKRLGTRAKQTEHWSGLFNLNQENTLFHNRITQIEENQNSEMKAKGN